MKVNSLRYYILETSDDSGLSQDTKEQLKKIDDIEGTKKTISQISSKVKHYQNEAIKVANKGLDIGKTKLYGLVETPEERKIIDNDLKTLGIRLENQIRDRANKISKISFFSKSKVQEEKEPINEFSINLLPSTITDLEILTRVQDENRKNLIRDILLGIAGFFALLYINSILLTKFYDVAPTPEIALGIGGAIVAPITEELAKYASIKITGDTTLANTIFAGELVLYMEKGFKTSSNFSNPMHRVPYLIFTLLQRIYGLRFHALTSKMYHLDILKYGNVRKITLLKGMGLHFLQNSSAGLVAIGAYLIGRGKQSKGIFAAIAGITGAFINATLISKAVSRVAKEIEDREKQKIEVIKKDVSRK